MNKDGKWVFMDMLTTSSGVFGDAFDPKTVEQASRGTLELALS